MASRIALIVTTILFSVGALSVLTDLGLADTQQTYSWETCDEGWTADDEGTLPGIAAWSRGGPGNESETSFQTGMYSDLQDATLTSLPYPWEGGSLTVEYFIAHDVEPEGSSVFDFAAFEWAVDGGDWTMEAQYPGQNEGYPAFVSDSITFEAPAGELSFRFRLHSDDLFSSVTEGWEGVFVDDVFIPLPKPEGAACEGGDPSPSASPTGDPSPSPSPSPTGGGSECTITGTSYGDHLEGTTGDDVICGLGGNDIVDGLGGDDVILGGPGDDTLIGGEGADQLRGARGDDQLRGGPDDDALQGGAGNDDLRGGGGQDTCKGGRGKDKLQGCE